MQFLKANTAVDVLIGPFVDETDGKTAETGLTLSQADIKLSKNGQALTQKNNANAATHDANGYYNCELSITDTNTEGTMVLIVHESGALPVRHEFMVLAEAAYDSLFVAKDTGFMDVNVKAVSEDTTAADNLESACDNYSATRGLAGTALPAAAADAAGGLPISDAGGLDLDTLNSNVTSILADTNELQGDWVNGGRLDLLIDAIKAVTDLLPNSGALTDIDTGINNLEARLTAARAGYLDNLNIGEVVAGTSEISGLNDITAADVWDAISATLSLSFEVMLDRIYRLLMNKMNITDATGAVALRNEGDDANIATQTITDDDTTTVRTALAWV